jgi:hypothetical protein
MSGSLTPGYYAVVHPTRNLMTYWRVGPNVVKGQRPWPSDARYLDSTPPPADSPDRDGWAQKQIEFYEHINWAIRADPDRCRARFAALTTRCGICGRTLRDARSKVEGIGPDCRKDFTDEQIHSFAEQVAEAHRLTIEVG